MSSELERVKGIGPAAALKLNKAGINTIEQLTKVRPEDLAWIKGIGMITAKNLIKNAKELIELEKGLIKVLDAIKENFVKNCPKCGGDMIQKFIIMGPERRINAYQCKICKFHMPK